MSNTAISDLDRGRQHEDVKLFAYFATADAVALKRLRNSIRLQKSVDKSEHQNIRRLLTLGDPHFEITEDLSSFFDEIILTNPYHTDRFGIRRLNYCALRNPSLSYAEKIKAKWLYFCDIDTVYVSVAEPPEENKFNIAKVYWQKSNEESLQWSINHIFNWGDAVFSAGNSWFIIHRDLFARFRFNEELWGYTFDDTDYCVRVCAAVGGPHSVDAHVVHIFHENALRNLEPVTYNRNQSIYHASLHLAMHCKTLSLEDYLLYYDPQLNEAILLNFISGKAFSSLHSEQGSFVKLDQLVMIRWSSRFGLYELLSHTPLERLMKRLAANAIDKQPATVKAEMVTNSGSEELQVDFANNVLYRGDASEIANFRVEGADMVVTWKNAELDRCQIGELKLLLMPR